MLCNLSIASDHAGFSLKAFLIKNVASYCTVRDYGTYNAEDSVDYPDYAYLVSNSVAKCYTNFGVLICATGVGMSIAANRYSGVRAALCTDVGTAVVSRNHNDANVLCMGAKIVSNALALDILTGFINAEFDGQRHARRVKKLCNIKRYQDCRS